MPVSPPKSGIFVSEAIAGKKNQKGFTLIELIVALVLAGIMMVGAFFICRDFMDTWDHELSSIEMQRQGTYALSKMGDTIKNGVEFSIGDYGGGSKNKLAVTVPTDGGDAKNIEYYWDEADTGRFKPVREKDETGPQTITIIPDTYLEGGQIRSQLVVEGLTFSNESGAGGSVRIDLKLKDTGRNGLTYDFTAAVRLRNENVE